MMSETKIRAVLFDFGGVVAEEGFYNGLISLAEKQALDAHSMPDEGALAAYDSGFVLGQGTASDFWALMRERTGLEGDDDFLSDRIIDGFQIRHWVIDLVRSLSEKGYITGILSDQTHWLKELDHYDHFFKEFDHIFNSYDLGKGKQDPTLFTDVVNTLKLQPDEVLFIDDHEDNIQRATAVGLVSLLYIDHRTFIAELEQILKQRFML
jgi:putative hydrolase of the HAD superfamily